MVISTPRTIPLKISHRQCNIGREKKPFKKNSIQHLTNGYQMRLIFSDYFDHHFCVNSQIVRNSKRKGLAAMLLVKLGFLLPVFVVCGQLYLFAVTRQGVEKQDYCRGVGIGYFTIGTVSLVSRDVYFTFGGLILIMLGLRLIAHGLDRLDKQIFIDRHEGSSKD